MKWTIGITTAPRQNSYYLDRTIHSLQEAGWSEITVFAEPGSTIPTDFKGHVVNRRKQYGDWTNWATGLYELFLSEPDTDYFFMLEDDAIVCHCKEYLEWTIPKLGKFANLSLYTPSIYAKEGFSGFHNEMRGFQTWSTVTVVMSHQTVMNFFCDEGVQAHRSHDLHRLKYNKFDMHKPEPKELNWTSYGSGYSSIIDTQGNTLKDAVIGRWADKQKLPIYYHTPSLAEHIGFLSTLTTDVSNAENGRMSKDFVGENFDASEWIGELKVKKFTSIPI